jgi:GNAT superfamily N-acetyltransferase
MPWTLTASLAEYLAAAGDHLTGQPVRYTIELGAVESLRAALSARPAKAGSVGPLFGWWRDADGEVTEVVLHTPPYPLLLGGLPPASAPELAALVAGTGRALPGVNSQEDAAVAFATAWQEFAGTGYAVYRRSRLHKLGQLTPPDPAPPGGPRVAGNRDRGLLEEWHGAFAAELNDLRGPIPGVIADRLSYGGLTLWEVGGRPVAMAGHVRPAAGVVRIGPVYTPPGLRGRGYGAAVTSAVTSAAIEAGASDVVLFTDLANPTSNALYRRLGYQPVGDRAVLSFGSLRG